MNTDFQTPSDPSTSALMGGIVEDIQHLVKQQLALTRQEIADDFRKGKEATLLYAFGGGVIFLGAVSLCFAAVHLLHWSTSPNGSDPASFPLWACHAAVGAVFAALGGILIWLGEAKWNTINPLHNSATDELKKNIEWGLHPK